MTQAISLTRETMEVGGRYNWRNQPDRLIYLGYNWSGNGYWHQFKKIGDPREVWCEVLDSDLHMLERSPPTLEQVVDQIRQATQPTAVYYHGGRGKLQRGAFLLPPSITKALSCSELGAAGVHRKDRVYITTSFDAAAMFAAGHPNGMVYQCEPIGAVEDDPDCTSPGMSFQCERARITKVIKLSKNELEFARQVMLGASERQV